MTKSNEAKLIVNIKFLNKSVNQNKAYWENINSEKPNERQYSQKNIFPNDFNEQFENIWKITQYITELNQILNRKHKNI